MSKHPEWLAVGSKVRTVRRGTTGVVAHEAIVTVKRHTKAGVYTEYPMSIDTDRYVLKGGRYTIVPSYLDYTEVLEPISTDKDQP